MFRLRTTTGLSVLALAIGIAGTGWLSTLTSAWQGPARPLAAARQTHVHTHALPSPRRSHGSHGPVRVVLARRTPVDTDTADSGVARATTPTPPELVPLSTPDDTSQTWDTLRGHLDGRVRLHVDIDGNGRVSAARVIESSADPVLDEHALRSVRGWRFAVPADRPDGLSGELPMRFSSQGDRVAQLP